MKDIGIIITTHGKLCDALKQTLFSITGEKEKVVSVPVVTEYTLETLCEKLQQSIKELNTEYTVIFTDMFGGTPCNASLMTCRNFVQKNVYIISGVNLYMLITAVNLREQFETISIEEYINKIIEDGRKCIVNVNEIFNKNK